MNSYLEQLTVRLATAVAAVPEETRVRHARYLIAAQRPDGGWAGRDGESDLYYTGFALRSLSVLGALHGELAERAAGYLRARLTGRETIVDFLSLIYSAFLLDSAAGLNVFAAAQPDWRTSVAQSLERLRRADGGYAKAPDGMASSTYHSFLVLLCLQLLDMPLPDSERLRDFVYSQRCDEGGFREIRASKRAGTNPTAAAIAALRILDAVSDEIREETIDFLVEMQTDEGGLRANTRIPIADLLSSFTGSLTLLDLDALEEIDVPAALRYAESLQRDSGGFQGAVWDPAYDVEYTFYGIGCLALLRPSPA